MTALRDCTDPATWWPHVDEATKALAVGGLVVLPTDTVYGIAADAFKPDAVQDLLDAKGRGRDMPPPVLIGDVRTMDGLADGVSDEVRELVTKFWPGPLTIILTAQPSLQWDLGETRGTVALRMPDHELTLAVLRRTGPLAVSSANTSGSPAATTAAEAASMLGGSVRVYLDGGTSPGGVASTIVDATGPQLRIVREGGLSAEDLGISAAEEAAEPVEEAAETAETAESGEETAAEPATPVRKPRTRKPKPAAEAEPVVPEDERTAEAAVADDAVVETAPTAPKPRRPRKPKAPVVQDAVVEDAAVEDAAVVDSGVETPADDVVVPEAVAPDDEPAPPDESAPPKPSRTRKPKEPVALQDEPGQPEEPAPPRSKRTRKPTSPDGQDTSPDASSEPPAEAPQP